MFTLDGNFVAFWLILTWFVPENIWNKIFFNQISRSPRKTPGHQHMFSDWKYPKCTVEHPLRPYGATPLPNHVALWETRHFSKIELGSPPHLKRNFWISSEKNKFLNEILLKIVNFDENFQFSLNFFILLKIVIILMRIFNFLLKIVNFDENFQFSLNLFFSSTHQNSTNRLVSMVL